jgi:hypothetical protein
MIELLREVRRMIYGSRWNHQPHRVLGMANRSCMAPSFEQQGCLSEVIEIVLSHIKHRRICVKGENSLL